MPPDLNRSVPQSPNPAATISPTTTPVSSGSHPTEFSRTKTEETRARVLETLNRTGDFTGNKGGRPPNIDGRVAELERLTGKKVILRGPDDKPEAVSLGDYQVSTEQFQELELESEDSLAAGFQSGSDLLADAINSEKVRTPQKQAKTLGKVWNRAMTKIVGARWLKWNAIIVAVAVTVPWFLSRFFEVLKYLMARRKQKMPAPAK